MKKKVERERNRSSVAKERDQKRRGTFSTNRFLVTVMLESETYMRAKVKNMF